VNGTSLLGQALAGNPADPCNNVTGQGRCHRGLVHARRATAAKRATSDIPIVMAAVGDPLATGLVQSLARPGGNITGTSALAADLAGKCIQLIHEMLPTARRIAALVNAPDPFAKPFLNKVDLAGKASGVAIDPVMINHFEEIDAAFAAMAQNRPDAINVQASLPLQHIAELSLKYRLPAISTDITFAEVGGLMSYWFDEATLYRRTAVFVDKILKGAKPADLPVELPTKFRLVLNLKTAKALGLTVPQVLLVQADEVID
jgi:putative ABC transport system substrate-binding protein